LDSLIINKIKIELERGDNKEWKKVLIPLYIERLNLLKYRAEKWIKKIKRESILEWNEESYGLKNIGYMWFNLISSEFYFGETNNVFRVRISQHFRDYNIQRKRRQYKRMRIIGFEEWIPIPLRVFYNSRNRLRWERKIIEKYHNQVINDKSTFSNNDSIKIANENTRKLIYKAISEDWSKYSISQVWHILNIENRFRLPRNLFDKFNEKAIERLNDNKYRFSYILNSTNDIKNMSQIKIVTKNILKKELEINDYNFITRRLQVLKVSNKTILDEIRNSAQVHKKVSSEDYLTCECENENEFKKIDGHVIMKSIEIKNNIFVDKYLKINIKTPLKSSKMEYDEVIRKGIYKIVKLFNLSVNIKKELMNISNRLIINNNLIDASNVKEEFKYFTKDKKYLIYELDKNTYSSNIVCAKKYKDDMIHNFSPKINRQYEIVKDNEEVLRKVQEENFEKLKISKKVKIKKEFQLGSAKIIYKNKDIKKTRNMVSFYNFAGKNAGKLIGRALNVIINLSKKIINNYDLSTPEDFKRIINYINKHYLKDKKKMNVTMIKMDVKNQYTSLDQKEGVISLRKILRIFKREYGDTIKIAKKKINKIKDSPGEGDKKYFRNVLIEEIIEYCLYEIENNYIKVGELFIVKQNDGFPIGGIVSSQLAIIDSIRREYEAKKLISNYFMKERKYIMRYRDDIFVLVFNKKNEKRVQEILSLANKMYDPTNYPNNKVEVELEEVSYKIMNFLDYKIIFENNFLKLTDNNANVSFNKKSYEEGSLKIDLKNINLWKRRYPSMESNYEKNVYNNIVVNVLEKTKNRNNDLLLYVFSQMCNIIEFMCLKYTSKLIVNCLFNVDRLLAQLLMGMIRGGLCCSHYDSISRYRLNS
jgi:hypothetical protein